LPRAGGHRVRAEARALASLYDSATQRRVSSSARGIRGNDRGEFPSSAKTRHAETARLIASLKLAGATAFAETSPRSFESIDSARTVLG